MDTLLINKSTENDKTVFSLTGKLNTTTAPELDSEVKTAIGEGAQSILMDFTDLIYLSSAGIRVLLTAHKTLRGKLIIKNANSVILEILDGIGLRKFLNIE